MLTIEYLMGLRLARDGKRLEVPGKGWLLLPTPEEVLEWFKFFGAGWVHDGNPAKPHAILHAGDHSTGFFMCCKVLDLGNLREILAACMIQELRNAGLGKVDGVFGSPQSSILLSGDVGRLLGVRTYVLEKNPKDQLSKQMLFKPNDPVPAGAVLLQIEELSTTFDSGYASQLAVVEGNPYPMTFAPQVGVLVNRPKKISRTLKGGRVLVPFIEREVAACPPVDCDLCKQGSPALTPKGENWAKLVA